jgi:iron complex outermembrane receptor protein
MDGMPSHVDRNYLAFGRGWTPVTGRLELHSEANTGPLKHRFLAGYELNWFGGKSDRGNQGGLTPPAIDFAHPIDNSEPIPFVRTSQDHYRHVTHSVYAFDHVHVLDNLIATGGLRADFLRSRVQREFLDRETQAVTANPMTGVRPPVVKDHAEALTGQIGAVFTPIEPITTYVSYATSFMPALVYPSNQGPNDFAPERGEQVEGGVRLRISPQQHVLQVDAALYYILKRNVVIPRGQDEYSQAGKVQSHGFDISLRYSAPRFIELDASYSYTRASYRTFVDVDPVTGENQSLKGKQVGFSPRHSANAWLRVLFTKQVGIGLGVRAMADQYADAENRVAMPDFALLDASAFVRARYATFILSANNVLDTHRYYTSVINTFNVNPQVTPGLGREVLGTVRLTY